MLDPIFSFPILCLLFSFCLVWTRPSASRDYLCACILLFCWATAVVSDAVSASDVIELLSVIVPVF